VVTPPSSQFVEDVGCVPSCAPSGGNLIYAIGTLPGGVSGSVLLTAKVKHPLPAGADSIVASAIIATSTPGDPSQGNAGQDVDLITTRPDLVVTADYEDVKPWPGKRVTYTIRYENLEPIATTLVTLTVKTHPDTEFQKKGSTGGWAEDGDNYYFYLPVLGYSQSGELVFVVTLTDTFSTETTDFDVTFEIDDSGVSGPDANPINNVYYAWLGVPDLVIEDVQVDPSVWAGEPGYVEVTVKNIGTGWACTIYNASGCFGFNLDPFLDPDEPPPSFPIKGFGDCYVEFPALPPGVARTAEISFTNLCSQVFARPVS
jgi:hypothetical protein